MKYSRSRDVIAAALRSAELWCSIVLDRALRQYGITSFAEILNPGQAEYPRYVLRKARCSHGRPEP